MKSRLRKVANNVSPNMHREVEKHITDKDGNRYRIQQANMAFLLAKRLLAALPMVPTNERVYECSSEYTSLIAYWIDVFSKADIIGNMTYNAGEALTKEDDDTYSYTFTYLSDMAGIWGAEANQIAFKLRPNSDWDGTDFGSYDEVTLDKSETYCRQDCVNIVCSNLVDGSTYKITFRLEDSELRVGVSTVQ